MNVNTRGVWDFAGDGYVHRLILNITDNNESNDNNNNGNDSIDDVDNVNNARSVRNVREVHNNNNVMPHFSTSSNNTTPDISFEKISSTEPYTQTATVSSSSSSSSSSSPSSTFG